MLLLPQVVVLLSLLVLLLRLYRCCCHAVAVVIIVVEVVVLSVATFETVVQSFVFDSTVILQVMMTLCCGSEQPSCWNLKYNPVSSNSTIPREQRSDIFIPIVVGDFSKATHVALLPPSGIAFVVPKLKPGAQASSLLTAVLEIWPLVILTVTLCVLSGIVIWALVSITLSLIKFFS